MSGWEFLVPLAKPILDALKSARDLFRGNPKPANSIDIPKRTLIILPDSHSHSLIWGLATIDSQDSNGMQISGRLQATNISNYAIRAAGIRVLKPRRLEIVTQLVTVEDAETGMHGSKNMIPRASIGEVSFTIIAKPIAGTPGKPIKCSIAIIDQFGNANVARNLEFKFVGEVPVSKKPHR
jgi:hypothetical protein